MAKDSILKVTKFEYTNSSQSIVLPPGKYKFEAWGASGKYGMCGNTFETRGRGADVSGYITFEKYHKIYIYVGSKGLASQDVFNGNKIIKFGGFEGGGGATDFRLSDGNWYDFNSLKTRIMVAAGGGGTDCVPGGDGGALVGDTGRQGSAKIQTGPGTQTSGGQGGQHSNLNIAFSGEFGIGGNGACSESYCDDAGSGGGGYYGGGGTVCNGGGSGGSSFISGYPGCDAINESSTKENIIHSNQSIHYSGMYFELPYMLSGGSVMPSPNKKTSITQTGNVGNGFAQITWLTNVLITCKSRKDLNIYIVLFILFNKD